MKKERSIICGMTDYTGVDLETIVDHLKGWKLNTEGTINKLNRHLTSVHENWDRIDNPSDIEWFITHFIDLFKRYVGDFARLISELPRTVEQRHIDILDQIYDNSEFKDNSCVHFKHEHIERALKDESLRILIDEIYANTREQIFDYKDLSNLSSRLRTYVGHNLNNSTSALKDIDSLELKPNIFGIGINLNHLIKKLANLFETNKNKTEPPR